MRPIKHIVITGANGFVGGAFVRYFTEQNYRVTALVRRIPEVKVMHAEYLLYDMMEQKDLGVFDPETVLIHTAFLKQQVIQDGEDVNIQASKNLLLEARRNNVVSCVFISSISVLSNLDSYYANQKRSIERLFNQENDLIIRPALVVGNGGLFKQSLETIKRTRLLPLVNGGQQQMYFVGINDVVNYTGQLIINGVSGVRVMSNKDSLTYREFYQTICALQNIKPLVLPVPLFLLEFAVWIFSFLKNPPITKDNLSGFKRSARLRLPENKEYNFADLRTVITSTML